MHFLCGRLLSFWRPTVHIPAVLDTPASGDTMVVLPRSRAKNARNSTYGNQTRFTLDRPDHQVCSLLPLPDEPAQIDRPSQYNIQFSAKPAAWNRSKIRCRRMGSKLFAVLSARISEEGRFLHCNRLPKANIFPVSIMIFHCQSYDPIFLPYLNVRHYTAALSHIKR